VPLRPMVIGVGRFLKTAVGPLVWTSLCGITSLVRDGQGRVARESDAVARHEGAAVHGNRCNLTPSAP
jgi:hypothetical protein